MDELDPSMKSALSDMNDTVSLILDIKSGQLETPGETTLSLRGETPAEALGHAYHLRDMLREHGYSAEAEHVSEAGQPHWSSKPLHEIRLSWDEGATE